MAVLLRRTLPMCVTHARLSNQEFTVAQNIRHAPSSRATTKHSRISNYGICIENLYCICRILSNNIPVSLIILNASPIIPHAGLMKARNLCIGNMLGISNGFLIFNVVSCHFYLVTIKISKQKRFCKAHKIYDRSRSLKDLAMPTSAGIQTRILYIYLA